MSDNDIFTVPPGHRAIVKDARGYRYGSAAALVTYWYLTEGGVQYYFGPAVVGPDGPILLSQAFIVVNENETFGWWNPEPEGVEIVVSGALLVLA